jgi:hypothetical protein
MRPVRSCTEEPKRGFSSAIGFESPFISLIIIG